MTSQPEICFRTGTSFADMAAVTAMYKEALDGARTLNDFFQMPDTIAITGGTVSEKVPEQYRNHAIAPQDSCAIDGRCNTQGKDILPLINIPNYKAVYGAPPEKLLELITQNNIYGGGATIANPWARIAFVNKDFEADPELINTLSVRDMIEESRYPFNFALEPLNDRELLNIPSENVVSYLEKQKKAYDMSAEAYRVKPSRPRWNVELGVPRAEIPFEKILVPDTNDERGFTELEGISGLERTYNPVGNEKDWIVDYVVAGVWEHPLKSDLKVSGSYGAHGLGTLGAETLPRFTEVIPEDNLVIGGNPELLATMHQMLTEEGINQYQMLICTTKSKVNLPTPPTMLLEQSGQEVATTQGMNYGMTGINNTLIMLGVIE